jgi:hypothetical protein
VSAQTRASTRSGKNAGRCWHSTSSAPPRRRSAVPGCATTCWRARHRSRVQRCSWRYAWMPGRGIGRPRRAADRRRAAGPGRQPDPHGGGQAGGHRRWPRPGAGHGARRVGGPHTQRRVAPSECHVDAHTRPGQIIAVPGGQRLSLFIFCPSHSRGRSGPRVCSSTAESGPHRRRSRARLPATRLQSCCDDGATSQADPVGGESRPPRGCNQINGDTS